MLFGKLFKYTVAVLKALAAKYGIWFWIVAILVWFFGIWLGIYIKEFFLFLLEKKKKRKEEKLAAKKALIDKEERGNVKKFESNSNENK
jgi:hypothetical protein